MDYFDTYAECISAYPTATHVVKIDTGKWIACHNAATAVTIARDYGGQAYLTN